MKFNFSLKGRQPAGSRYTFLKAGITDVQSELYRALLSLSLYSDLKQRDEVLLSVRESIRNSDPAVVAALAVYLNGQKSFDQLAFLLTAELAAISGNEERVASLIPAVVRSAADVPAWLTCFHTVRPDQKPARSIRKALAAVLNQLEEYPFSRYSRDIQLRIKEALLFLKPRPAGSEQRELFGRIRRDQFPVRSTWEQEWHALHQQHYDSLEQRQVTFRDKWKEGISSFRIGYTALLDNLQPMLCTGVSGKVLKLAAEYLGNAAAVSRSGVSPLRLLEVYRSLRKMDQGGAGMLSEALEHAVLHSSWVRSEFGRNAVSVIAMDVSNSMKRPVNTNGGVSRFDIAPLLANLWKHRGDRVITGIIGNTWKPMELPAGPVLLATDGFRVREGEAGYAINGHLVIKDLLRKRLVVDKVLIFTDTRLWGSRSFHQHDQADLSYWWRKYRNELAPAARLYLFDLAGYYANPLESPGDDVFVISGWKEGILEVLGALESKSIIGTSEENT